MVVFSSDGYRRSSLAFSYSAVDLQTGSGRRVALDPLDSAVSGLRVAPVCCSNEAAALCCIPSWLAVLETNTFVPGSMIGEAPTTAKVKPVTPWFRKSKEVEKDQNKNKTKKHEYIPPVGRGFRLLWRFPALFSLWV